MDLPVRPPLKPMLAKAVKELPEGPDLLYEPKWDGFRCIVFRDGDDVELGSRNERPLTRYFPELVPHLRANLPERCVLDGELVIVTPHGLDFDALQQRIHPAASRIERLSGETPASFVAFDLLALGDRSLLGEPFRRRRRLLEDALAGARPPVYVTPTTTDPELAARWFEAFEGAGLDGLVIKPLGDHYQPDKRVLAKLKHERTADCVVAGYRLHKDGEGVGSLLLGLYDDEGVLHHVGVASSFSAARRRELLDELRPLELGPDDPHPWREWYEQRQDVEPGQRMPGAVSRWNATKDLSFTPVRIERVVEVAFEKLEGRRFRHSARFRRWRDDRAPRSCTYDQLDVARPFALAGVFASPD